jgi:lipopolysaccharide/colanic/teichoic acid biosynthesis glycosyltransferase
MKSIFKNFWPFAVTIAIFAIVLGCFLIKHDKVAGHLLINQHHSFFGDVFFKYMTRIGDGFTAIIVIITLLCWRWEYGLLALIAFGFTAGITQGLKYFVFEDAKRPFLEMWTHFHSGPGHTIDGVVMKVANSFPSGHTTSAMSIFCILALIIKKNWASFTFAILAILASISRMYLSQHFAEDVFAGTLIGTLGTILIYMLFAEKLKKKFIKYPSYAKRAFDIISSSIVLLLGAPFFIIISILIATTSKGGIFFQQKRVGKGNKEFGLYKFRTMKPGSEKLGQITVGGKDPRITKIGYFLRKFKLDEFPQLINVLKGEMSIVGPRPEVKKYVDLYTEQQLHVLTVNPGLTDFASIEYMDENVLLGKSENPDQTYINKIMPAKLNLNLKYIDQQSFKLDMQLIFRTIGKLFR